MEARPGRSTRRSIACRRLQLAGYQDGSSGDRAAGDGTAPGNGSARGDSFARHGAAGHRAAGHCAAGHRAAGHCAAYGDRVARGDQDRAARTFARA
jgi:hypothetical protein